MKWIWEIIVLLVAVFCFSVHATIINVPDDLPTIQMGIIFASNGDTVLVQPSTYPEAMSFYGRNITVGSLYLTTHDTSYISQTIIDGMDMWIPVTFAAGEDSSAILSGFTITQGFGTDAGGIMCDSVTSPTITACRIIDNQGNGIYCKYSSPTLDSCTISFNSIRGICMVGSSNPIITNCHIHHNTGYGVYCENGSPTISGCTISSNYSRGIYITGVSQAAVSGCDIEYNSEGISLGSDAHPTLIGNNVSNNSGFPVTAYADQLGGFSGNTYLGNGSQYIFTYGGGIQLDATWENPGIPYYISNDISIQGTDGADDVTTLTLDSGVELRFGNEVGLTVGDNGSSALIGALNAVGTVSDSIIFTAMTPTPSAGYWDGVYFSYWCSDSLSELSYCVVEYGGYSINENIFCNGSSPEISHSNIHHGSGPGIYCSISTACPVVTDCHIHNNTAHGIYCENGSPTIYGCTISSNSLRGIELRGYSQAAISGCDIEYNSSIGIYLESDAHPTITGNNISNNSSYPIAAYADQLGGFSGNTYSGNGSQFIFVSGGSIHLDATWENPNIPYYIAGDISIQGTDGADNVTTLTLDSGVELRFGNQYGLTVGDNASPALIGALNAVGTVSDSIIFTAYTSTPSPGYWDGIYFDHLSSDSLSQLSYCVVEYGGYSNNENIFCSGSAPEINHSNIHHGSGSGIYCAAPGANSIITDCYIHDNTSDGVYCVGCSPTISGCTISSNSDEGIFVYSSSQATISGCDIEYNSSTGIFIGADAFPTVTGNNISNNGSYPVSAYANQIGGFSGNTYTDNTYQLIHIVGGAVTYDAIWEDPGIPYEMTGEINVQGTDGTDNVTTLILNPGVSLRFDSQIGLWIGTNSMSTPGALSAVGTEESKITFTTNQTTPSPGYWDGIYFYDYASDSLSELTYCIVEYGGYSSNENIYCYSSSPSITHTEVHHGSGTGIQCYNDANPTITECQIHDNTSYGIVGNISSPVLTRCAVYSNTNHGVFAIGASTLVTITNNTISDNSYGVYCNTNSSTIIKNSIIWGNLTQNMYIAAGCSTDVTYSDIQGGWTGTGNIDNDPLFWDAANNDYHLTVLSPCIDAGDPASPLDPDSTRADMGTYFFDHYLGSPVITAITDVPEDQGRYVIVTWERSPLDSFAAPIPIVGYNLWELWPFEDSTRTTTHDMNEAVAHPELLFMTDDTTWIHISYIAAMQWEEYNALAETFLDSSSVADNPSHFFVSAHTTTPYWYYESEIDSGYSVDNIPPNPVIDAVITTNPGLISINWSEITEGSWQGNSYPELNGVWYRVYGSSDPGFIPNPSNLLMVTDDPEFQHEIGTYTKFFYIVQTSDDH